MTVRAFEPQFMKVGILTAALQELTPRRIRDADPDRAMEDWIGFAAELGVAGLSISDIGYFDNMLHDDAASRRRKHAFMGRVFDAAALLGVEAVCGFVGRNVAHSMDENLRDFENSSCRCSPR